MPILSQVTNGSRPTGQRIIIAGVEKVGKTTLACNAPRALLVPMEMGNASIRTPVTPLIERWSDLMALIDELGVSCRQGRNPYMTITFDSATALERLIHDKVIGDDPDVIKGKLKNPTMATAHEGYGKAFDLANGHFADFLRKCDELAIYAGINIVLTCHVFASRVVDPAFGEYDSWDLLLHSPKNLKSYGKREMATQWADMIGFLHEPLYVNKTEKGQQVIKAISANQGRMLAVDRTPGWVAGNRYGLTGTIAIPKPPDNPNQPYRDGWNTLAQSIYNAKGIDLFNRDVLTGD